LGAESRDLLGKLAGRFGAQPLRPFDERAARRLEQRRDLVVGQQAGELDGRQPRAMEYFVGVRIADAAEQSRIGERAFDRVALAAQPLAEFVEPGVERLESAARELGERGARGREVKRRTPL